MPTYTAPPVSESPPFPRPIPTEQEQVTGGLTELVGGVERLVGRRVFIGPPILRQAAEGVAAGVIPGDQQPGPTPSDVPVPTFVPAAPGPGSGQVPAGQVPAVPQLVPVWQADP